MPTSTDALEVIVLSLEDACAAAAGGATRLEVVREIEADGLTPSRALVETLLAHVRIPLRVMVRPRNTFTIDDDAHRAEVLRDALQFADLPVDLVTGYVRTATPGQTRLDLDALDLVRAAAPRARLTVHRAVERVSANLAADLRRGAAVDRILSGGGEGTWSDRADALDRLQQRVAPLRVVVGGGVTDAAVEALARRALLRELHVGRLARRYHSFAMPVDASIVARLRARWIGRDAARQA